jgi:hypothetical protein
VKDLLGKSIFVAVAAALAMSLLGDAIVATLGVALLATAVLVPIACSIRLRQDLNSLVFSSLLWRLLVISLVGLWILPYYAARDSADAVWYDSQAVYLMKVILAGGWSQIPLNVGSDMVTVITALLYLPFGPTVGGLTFLSGLLGFIGSLYFVAAAAVALPSSRLRGYAMFVLLLPSIVFWSTLFGKDSWVFCGLGICAFGIARWLQFGQWTDLPTTLIGLGVLYAFRPHIALSVTLALALTTIACRARKSRRSATKSVIVLLFLAPMMIFIWRAVSDMAGVSELSRESMVNRISQQGRETTAGGSTVVTTETEGLRGFITELPNGAVRLLFRPWPWEATSPFMFVAALDNIALLTVLLVNRRNVLDTLRHLRAQPFAFFCVALVIQLIVAFSAIPNLGLLVREKTQVTPFLLFLAFSGNARVVRQQRPTRRDEADAAWPSRIPDGAPHDSEGVTASRP